MARACIGTLTLLALALSAAASTRTLSQSTPGVTTTTTQSPPTSSSPPPVAASTTPPATASPGPSTSGLPGSYCNCSLDYTPVCGLDQQTYGNACIAKCANQAVASQGKCQTCTKGIGQTASCQCNGLPYGPVCAVGLTFDTTCDAECSGKWCYTQGVCQYEIPLNSTSIASNDNGPAAGGVAAAASNTNFPAATATPAFDYAEAVTKSLLFYQSMRSGTLDQQVLAWRSDSCFDCVGPAGEDLSKGYYEAGGSFLKLGLPEAYTVTNLAWGAASFAAGYAKANETAEVNDAIKWGADYLVSAWNPALSTFVAVVGNNTLDFNYYGPLEEYEQYLPRPVFVINNAQPGSEIAGEAAAALAAAHLANASTSSDYLTPAKQLYAFAKATSGSYMNNSNPGIEIHAALYPSKGFLDELAWGAAWLYKATNTPSYLTDAQNYYNQCCNMGGYTYEVGLKGPALHVLMSQIDPSNAQKYGGNAQAFFNQYLQQSIPHTTKGLAYAYHWGAMRPAMSAAFLALQYSSLIKTSNPTYAAQLFNYAQFQVNYALGDGGRSWIVGYGTDYPQYVWHKPSYTSYIDWPLRGVYQWLGRDTGPWTSPTDPAIVDPVIIMATKLDIEGGFSPQPFIAYGALYAAPMRNDNMVVGRRDYTYAEPTVEGQGGFQGAVAGLAAYYTSTAPFSKCSLDLGWGHPNATTSNPKAVINTAQPGCSSATGVAG